MAAFRPDLQQDARAKWIVFDLRTIRTHPCVNVPDKAPWKGNATVLYYVTGTSDLPFCAGGAGVAVTGGRGCHTGGGLRG